MATVSDHVRRAQIALNLRKSGTQTIEAEATTGRNIGGGAASFAGKDGVELLFRTLKAGNGCTVEQGEEDITIAAVVPDATNTRQDVYDAEPGVPRVTVINDGNDIKQIAPGNAVEWNNGVTGGTGNVLLGEGDPTIEAWTTFNPGTVVKATHESRLCIEWQSGEDQVALGQAVMTPGTSFLLSADVGNVGLAGAPFRVYDDGVLVSSMPVASGTPLTNVLVLINASSANISIGGKGGIIVSDDLTLIPCGDNLALDGDMEGDLTDWTTTGTVTKDATYKHAGTKSLKLANEATSGQGQLSIGTEYIFAVWAANHTGATKSLYLKDGDDAIIATLTTAASYTFGAHYIQFTATTADWYFMGMSEVNTYIDDLQIREVGVASAAKRFVIQNDEGGVGVIADVDFIQENVTGSRTLSAHGVSYDLKTDIIDEITAAQAASHARSHALTSSSDHTSTATAGKMLKADANGLPVDATNTDTEVSGAVSASHTRSHAMTGASDHTAGNWKAFYSNGSGALVELALGADGTYLKSNGASAAPTFASVAASADEKAKVSAADTTAGYLNAKVLGTANKIVATLTTPGGAETLVLSAGSDILDKAVSSQISGVTAKATPTTADYLLIEDAAAANAKKSITIGSLPAPSYQERFHAPQARPLAVPPGLGTRNYAPTIDFDPTADESCFFDGVLRGWRGVSLTVVIEWVTAATSGNCIWKGAFERNLIGTSNIDTDSFGTEKSVTTACSGTSGIAVTSTLTFTVASAEVDSLAEGEGYRFRLVRNASSASDTITTQDCRVRSVTITG